MKKAFIVLADLESGAIANPEENRVVRHYWQLKAGLASTPEIRKEIEEAISKTHQFAAQLHCGSAQGGGGVFKNLLLIGIEWQVFGNDTGSKNVVFLTHKDRLNLFLRWIQHVAMKSSGKELYGSKKMVNQGVCAFGNKRPLAY